MIGTVIDTNAAAVRNCQPPPKDVVRVASTTDSGWFSASRSSGLVLVAER